MGKETDNIGSDRGMAMGMSSAGLGGGMGSWTGRGWICRMRPELGGIDGDGKIHLKKKKDWYLCS